MLLLLNSFLIFLSLIGLGYCIGSIPSGWIIAYLAGVDDITKRGSGNIGATNVGRILGLRYFVVVLLLDGLKAYLFMHYVQAAYGCGLYMVCSSLALLLGNGFSFFLQGKGGKGVATSLGILCSVQPFIIWHLFLLWLVVASMTKKMGIACAAALLFLPFFSYFFNTDIYMYILFVCISAWGLWRHERNIRHYFAWGKLSL